MQSEQAVEQSNSNTVVQPAPKSKSKKFQNQYNAFVRGLEGLEQKIGSKRQQAQERGHRKDSVIRLSNIRKDQRQQQFQNQQQQSSGALLAPQRSEETLIIEDESFQFAQITQSQQQFVNLELLNSNLDESCYEQIYNLDREFSQLFQNNKPTDDQEGKRCSPQIRQQDSHRDILTKQSSPIREESSLPERPKLAVQQPMRQIGLQIGGGPPQIIRQLQAIGSDSYGGSGKTPNSTKNQDTKKIDDFRPSALIGSSQNSASDPKLNNNGGGAAKQNNGSQNSIPKIQGRVLKLGSVSKIQLVNCNSREQSAGAAARASSDTRNIVLGRESNNLLTKSKTKIKLLNKNQITVQQSQDIQVLKSRLNADDYGSREQEREQRQPVAGEEDLKEQQTHRDSQRLIKVRSKSSITNTGANSANIFKPRIKLKSGQENNEQFSMKKLIDMQKQKSQHRQETRQMTQEGVGSTAGSQDSRAAQGLLVNKKIRLSNVSSERMKKLKIRSRATSNKSDNQPQAMSDNGSTQLQSNKPIKLGNFKKMLLLKDSGGGQDGSTKTPCDQGNKRVVLLGGGAGNLPPRISVNKGSNPIKLKIRTNSEDPQAVRCQSAQSQVSGQSACSSQKRTKLSIKTKSSGRNSAGSALSILSKGSTAGGVGGESKANVGNVNPAAQKQNYVEIIQKNLEHPKPQPFVGVEEHGKARKSIMSKISLALNKNQMRGLKSQQRLITKFQMKCQQVMDDSGGLDDQQNGTSDSNKKKPSNPQIQLRRQNNPPCEEDKLTMQIQEQQQNVQDTFEGTILETKRHTTDSQGGANISKQSNAQMTQFTPKFNDKESKQSTTDRHRHTSSLNVVETSRKASNAGSDEDDPDGSRQHRSACGVEVVPQFHQQQQARVGQNNVSINQRVKKMKVQSQNRDCKTQVLESCINIAKMPEKDLQEHVNSQIKLSYFLSKSKNGGPIRAPIPQPAGAKTGGGTGTPTSNSNPNQFKSFKLFHKGNQPQKQPNEGVNAVHLQLQSQEKLQIVSTQAVKQADSLQSTAGKEPVKLLRSPQQDSFMNESLPECQLSNSRKEAATSQMNPNGTIPINRQSTYGGNSSSTRISGSSPNQTVLQGSEHINGNLKKIGLVPKEVKQKMRTQRTGCGTASVNQSFGIGGFVGPAYASNHVMTHESQQDAKSGKNFSSNDSVMRSSVNQVHEQSFGIGRQAPKVVEHQSAKLGASKGQKLGVKVRNQRDNSKPAYTGATVLTKKGAEPEDAAGNDLFSEKTVYSPNYRPNKSGNPEKRKTMSFNSPHNLGGIKQFVFPGGPQKNNWVEHKE